MLTVYGWREPSKTDTVVVLAATDDETGELVEVASDRRMAEEIVLALKHAAVTGDDKPQIDPEPYLILSRRRKTLGDYGYNND